MCACAVTELCQGESKSCTLYHTLLCRAALCTLYAGDTDACAACAACAASCRTIWLAQEIETWLLGIVAS